MATHCSAAVHSLGIAGIMLQWYAMKISSKTSSAHPCMHCPAVSNAQDWCGVDQADFSSNV